MSEERRARGEGSMRERPGHPGAWRLRYVARNGREVQRTFKGSKSAAARELRRLISKEQESAEQADPSRTFGNVLDEWLAYGRTVRGQQWSPKTASENWLMVESRIRPALGAIKLAELSVGDLERTYASWQASEEGWSNGLKKKLSDRSVAKLHATIKTALGLAERRGWVDRNVALRAVAPAQARKDRRPPTADQVVRLLEAAETVGNNMAPAIALAAVTGARLGEICGIRWDDVDFDAGTVRVERSVGTVAGQVYVKSTKTGMRYTAYVNDRDLAVLKVVVGRPGDGSHYVIGNSAEPTNPHAVTDRFAKVRAVSGIRSVTFHDLRHYWTTQQLAAGNTVHDVAAGRWATPQMVIARYGHRSEAATERLARVPMLTLPAGQ